MNNTKSDRINQVVVTELSVFMNYELGECFRKLFDCIINSFFFSSFLCVESWLCGD